MRYGKAEPPGRTVILQRGRPKNIVNGKYSRESCGVNSPTKTERKVIGYVEKDNLIKRVQGSKHMLRKPPAWYISREAFYEKVLSNTEYVIIEDLESGLVYECLTRVLAEHALLDMEWQNADTTSGLDINLPFEIHDLFEIHPGNILFIAGTTNAIKIAYLLNFVKDNTQRWDIDYFTSDLSDQELKKRISKSGDGIDWRFYAHERNSHFDGVIIPDAINIIDYLDPPIRRDSHH
jgi:hypothetical protein